MAEQTIDPRPAPSSPRPIRIAARVLVALLALAAAIGVFMYLQSGDKAAGPGSGGGGAGGGGGMAMEPPEVSVVVVQEQAVPLAPRYLGRTQASLNVEIRARVNGFLEERSFEEGSAVEQGQVLYRIDPRPFEAEVAVAKARLANAQAKLERASRQADRLREAADRGAATPSELDQWETDELVARAEAQLEEARLFQAELELGYTTIESPIAGVIGQTLKDAGTYVQAGPEGLLAVVQQQDPIYINFSVSERELLRWQKLIASGAVRMPATDQAPLAIELADGSLYPRTGHLDLVGIQVEPTTGTALMRGSVPNPERRVLPGQFVRVTAQGIERVGAVVVPQRAVLQSPTGASVYVVGEDGTLELRPVELGEWVGDEGWIVTEGLVTGDRVVVDRLMQLQPGMAVRVGAVLPPPSAALPPPSPSTPPAPAVSPASPPAASPSAQPQVP